MKKLISIGEALIDMIATEKDCTVKQATAFSPKVGGAPANVCGAFAKLGGKSALITMLGRDAFGDKITEYIQSVGIETSYILRTDKANTALAFVSRDKNGERSFSFYRNPSADMLLSDGDIQKDWFDDCYALHFCSVSLGNFPMRKAHEKAIEYAKNSNSIISFDPNLRFALWDSKEELKQAVLCFIPKCDVLKISDEELEFITGKSEIQDALSDLFIGEVKLVIYTQGKSGAEVFSETGREKADGIKVSCVDTTGAGDAFIGAFLYSLYRDGVCRDELDKLSGERLRKHVEFANRYSAYSVQSQGAIESYPTAEQMDMTLKSN